MINIFLLIYFILYFWVAFVLKSFLVAKKIGKSPLVLLKDDSAYGLIGFYFKLVLVSIAVYTFSLVFVSNMYIYSLPIEWLEGIWTESIGVMLLVFSFLWTILAQWNMRNSWRIGIDTVTKTELITTGLFGYSRNPIFFGMIVSLLWLFLITPNALTAIFLILGYILIQIQIRLEEEFLFSQHGEVYVAYRKKVRRII
jgi:protein-S-isoprenylcysteine O-methyltransferase Ste14